MSLETDVAKLTPGALIDLFILDMSPLGLTDIYHFHPGTDANSQPIYFQGQSYAPWPLEINGVKKTGQGPEPRPSIIISNINGMLSTLLKSYDDMVGAKVSRLRTLAQYLNTADYNPNNFYLESYFVEQKPKENSLFIELTLASAMDFLDQQLPARRAVANSCPWRYKSTENGSGCPWPGTNSIMWFNANDEHVFTSAEDVCSKKLSGCKVRFKEAPLPFGAFPALGRV